MHQSFLVSSVFWVLLLSLGACQSPEKKGPKGTELVEETDPSGFTERYFRSKSSGQKEGRYLMLRPDGSLIEEAFYRNGALHGKRILYFENQDTMTVETHVNGQYQGPYRSYYKDGTLKISGEYTDNKMQGWWLKYYPTGELMEKVTFVDNQEHGPFIEYHKNGQISVEGQYIDGDNENGELKFYTETGIHYRTMRCDTGLCRTIWRREEPVQ